VIATHLPIGPSGRFGSLHARFEASGSLGRRGVLAEVLLEEAARIRY
jgi:hypothetical protein